MKYFIDVDGVIRNFSKAVGLPQKTKWAKLPNEIWLDIDKRPKKYMYDAEPYMDIINFIKKNLGVENCVFLTNQCRIPQREEWTVKFIEKYFGKGNLILFTGNFQEKVNILKYNSEFLLFDDYPFFFEKNDFDEIKNRIVIVNRAWNQDYLENYVMNLKYNEKLNEYEIKMIAKKR